MRKNLEELVSLVACAGLVTIAGGLFVVSATLVLPFGFIAWSLQACARPDISHIPP